MTNALSIELLLGFSIRRASESTSDRDLMQHNQLVVNSRHSAWLKRRPSSDWPFILKQRITLLLAASDSTQ
ncbi:hypothetical protein BPAE_0516g00010 [Botrytis paeoniae]|uniref:Uncharacterized protein n=1 Tax=Botrytis paeoniae TaxID=278948 RepID=A0A4Z1EUL9_9HELO|nr:hypothetical protein BPAE_0516g00010 [Botrytis paeoniae]